MGLCRPIALMLKRRLQDTQGARPRSHSSAGERQGPSQPLWAELTLALLRGHNVDSEPGKGTPAQHHRDMLCARVACMSCVNVLCVACTGHVSVVYVYVACTWVVHTCCMHVVCGGEVVAFPPAFLTSVVKPKPLQARGAPPRPPARGFNLKIQVLPHPHP